MCERRLKTDRPTYNLGGSGCNPDLNGREPAGRVALRRARPLTGAGDTHEGWRVHTHTHTLAALPNGKQLASDRATAERDKSHSSEARLRTFQHRVCFFFFFFFYKILLRIYGIRLSTIRSHEERRFPMATSEAGRPTQLHTYAVPRGQSEALRSRFDEDAISADIVCVIVVRRETRRDGRSREPAGPAKVATGHQKAERQRVYRCDCESLCPAKSEAKAAR